jgi:polyphosphate kinase
MERVVKSRRTSSCVRLEMEERCTQTLLRFLQRALGIGSAQCYEIPGPLNLSNFMQIAELPGFDELRFEPWPPQPSPDIDLRRSIFDEMAEKNVFLYHPYDSFDPVLRLVEEAARDPDVLAVKQILYRTSTNSPVIAALKEAASRGKSVTVIVELKARFDEARNIEQARALEEAGVQVIYGVKGYKTHAKLCIVVRREPHGIVRYLHFGTGNYNEKTACLYSDASYMTRDPDLGRDASSFFNAITGYSEPQKYLKVEAAPTGLRDRLKDLIEAETQRSLLGQKGHIIAKINSLVDADIIKALYKASRAGVRIQLNVRGICCLRPGVRGLSSTIEVVSIVDRFLEHARLFYFHHGGKPRMFLSSADWMPRNIDRRIELFVPVDDAGARKRLLAILKTYFRDTSKAHRLLSDGSYERLSPGRGAKTLSSQAHLYGEVCARVSGEQQTRPTVFEPHLPPKDGG